MSQKSSDEGAREVAQTRVAGQVRIGHIYECEFGLFKKGAEGADTTVVRDEADDTAYNYRIPNELIKRRAVVVIGKHRGLYLVVPVSSTFENGPKPHKVPENSGMHVQMGGDFPVTARYAAGKPRWAKSNLVQAVDGGRLTDVFDPETRKNIPAHQVSENTLMKIRYGVMISMGMGKMVPVEEPAPVEAAAANGEQVLAQPA
nr:type II toxin-antitoxin system PemK/MazF family toxin [Pseudomonas viridiflava]